MKVTNFSVYFLPTRWFFFHFESFNRMNELGNFRATISIRSFSLYIVNRNLFHKFGKGSMLFSLLRSDIIVILNGASCANRKIAFRYETFHLNLQLNETRTKNAYKIRKCRHLFGTDLQFRRTDNIFEKKSRLGQ